MYHRMVSFSNFRHFYMVLILLGLGLIAVGQEPSNEADSIKLDSLQSITADLQPLVHRVFYPLINDKATSRLLEENLLDTSFVHPLQLNYSTLFPRRNSDFMEFSNVGYNGRRLIFRDGYSNRAVRETGMMHFVDRMHSPVEQIPFFDVPSPFTQLAFRMNYTEGQYSRFTHARSFNAHSGLMFSYERSNSQGVYSRQSSLQNRLMLNGYGRLGAWDWIGWARWAGWNQEENGGIANREAFLQNTITDRLVFPVSLANAESTRRIRNYGGKITREIGEVGTLEVMAFHDRHRYDYVDTNPDTLYYSAIFRDSTATQDSLAWAQSGISFGWLGGAQKVGLSWRLGVDLKRDDFQTADVNRFANWVTFRGHLNYQQESAMWRAEGWLHGGDYFGQTGGARLIYRDSLAIGPLQAVLMHRSFRPELFWSELHFNHANWSLLPQISHATSLQMAWSPSPYHHITLGADRVGHYIYLTENRTPEQQQVGLLYASWQGGWQFWGQWHVDAEARLQTYGYSGSTDPIRVPNFHGLGALYLEDRWFQGALELQMGLRGRWFSRGIAMDYAPELGAEIASSGGIQVGGYPQVDVFLHGRIRTFYAYILLQHAQKGFSGYDYFVTPTQPFPERSLRIGLAWKFYN